MRNRIFYVILIGIPVSFFIIMFFLLRPYLEERFRPHLVSYLAMTMTGEKKDRLYSEVASSIGSVWDVAAEPMVARLAKKDFKGIDTQAEVITNNAQMRSTRPYTSKPADVYRIVCLGDSFVFGTGGKEEDRFSDQIEDFYRTNKITAEDKRIESYALGLGGWTTVQEASYLASRISSYDPDLIIVLTVSNDITDASGVSGAGFITSTYSPEHRDWGSSVFSNKAGAGFGSNRLTALTTDLCPEAEARWEKAMSCLERLARLQHRRGKKMVLSLLNVSGGKPISYLHEIFVHNINNSGMNIPWFFTSYFSNPKNRLSHDSHPSRKGHEILRNYYVTALNELGWIKTPAEILPPIDSRLKIEFNRKTDEAFLKNGRNSYIKAYLKTSLDFSKLKPDDLFAFLGGILPESYDDTRLSTPPWASVRAGFLLKLPDEKIAGKVHIKIGAPSIPELFPLSIKVHINGRFVQLYEFDTPSNEREYEMVVELPEMGENRVVEVLLETDCYFTEISDPRMKSYRLISAKII